MGGGPVPTLLTPSHPLGVGHPSGPQSSSKRQCSWLLLARSPSRFSATSLCPACSLPAPPPTSCLNYFSGSLAPRGLVLSEVTCPPHLPITPLLCPLPDKRPVPSSATQEGPGAVTPSVHCPTVAQTGDTQESPGRLFRFSRLAFCQLQCLEEPGAGTGETDQAPGSVHWFPLPTPLGGDGPVLTARPSSPALRPRGVSPAVPEHGQARRWLQARCQQRAVDRGVAGAQGACSQISRTRKRGGWGPEGGVALRLLCRAVSLF